MIFYHNIYIYTLSCIITFFSTEINKRTYVVRTYPHQSHHVLINKSVHARGYADTPGNGPKQSRLTNAVCSVPGRFLLLRHL